MTNTLTRTHKASGWTRTPLGYGNWKIVATDGTECTVAFLSAHSWQNLPNDDRAKQHQDRIVLVDGPQLPVWAVEWLEKANAKSCESGRRAFQSAMDDADWNQSRNEGW